MKTKLIFKKLVLVSAFLLLTTTFLVGCMGEQVEKPADETPVDIVNPNPSQEEIVAKVYFSDPEAMYLVPEEIAIVKDNRPLAELLVERLIAGPTKEENGVVIPPETKLISLEIIDGIAYVNFSQEIKTNHWGGSTGENMTIYSVVNTLTELPEIDQVQFLIEGEKEEVIWGHGYTMEPFEYFPDIVAPENRR